jgi:deoxyribonuclease-4
MSTCRATRRIDRLDFRRTASEIGTLRVGIHTSIAKSLENAALKAADLGANTFQIFSCSPRMWRASAHARDDIVRLRAARKKYGLDPLVVHANYLVNLAAADPIVRARSVEAFRGELERSEAIGAEYVVLHPGSYRGSTLESGIETLARGLAAAAEGLGTLHATVLLENTVGSGSQIGSRFEELHSIRDLAGRLTGLRIGYCLDTCHLLAAGFDIATAGGLEQTVAEAERILGLGNVAVIHANDSKKPLASRLDRHENIGAGYIGKQGFRRILAHPKLRSKPFILETPVEEEGDDRRNLDMLKKLWRSTPRSRT